MELQCKFIGVCCQNKRLLLKITHTSRSVLHTRPLHLFFAWKWSSEGFNENTFSSKLRLEKNSDWKRMRFLWTNQNITATVAMIQLSKVVKHTVNFVIKTTLGLENGLIVEVVLLPSWNKDIIWRTGLKIIGRCNEVVVLLKRSLSEV